jgi:hypothetical protein
MTASNLAKTYLGRAAMEKDPGRRSHVLRDGAAAFARLAADPRNAKARNELTTIGLQFAGASLATIKPEVAGMHHDTAVELRDHHAITALYPEGIEEAIEQGESPASLPPSRVSIAPASFYNGAVLGRVASVTFNPTAAQVAQNIKAQQTVAFWQGTKFEAQAMSIDVGLVLPPVVLIPKAGTIPSTEVDSRLYAEIQYGVDGNTQNVVRVDMGLGRKINVVANYITVAIGMDAPASAPGYTNPVISVGGSIGAFPSPSQAPVVRTVYADPGDFAVVGGIQSSKGYLIPARAVSLLPIVPSTGATSVLVTFFTPGGDFISTWSQTTQPIPVGNPPIPIPPDAASFVVQLSSIQIFTAEGIRIQFELSL